MGNGFTKLFSSIITSSVWSEDDKVRIMWITMLASADAGGRVTGSIPGMAAVARMSLQDAEQSIAALCSPDPYSRSKKRQGCRLIEADGGWLIVNYVKYRQKRDPEKRRAQNREAQRRYRQKKTIHEGKQGVSQSKPKSAQAEAEAEAEAEKPPTGVRAPSGFQKPSVEEVSGYARSIDYSLNAQQFIDYYESCGWRVGRNPMKDWRAAVRTWKARDAKDNPETLDQQFARLEKAGAI
jgi:hypothetical protein